MDHTIRPLDMDKGYHADVLRANLTRNVTTTFQGIHDELVFIPVHGDGAWKSNTLTMRFLEFMWNAKWVKFPVVETM